MYAYVVWRKGKDTGDLCRWTLSLKGLYLNWGGTWAYCDGRGQVDNSNYRFILDVRTFLFTENHWARIHLVMDCD